jgi:hypothetical protein
MAEQKWRPSSQMKSGLLVLITILGLVMMLTRTQQLSSQRKHYESIVQEAERIKALVTPCMLKQEQLSDCKPGSHGIPKNLLSNEAAHSINDVIILENGIIRITPKQQHGISQNDIYQLVPHKKNQQLEWSNMGKSIERGLANQYQ